MFAYQAETSNLLRKSDACQESSKHGDLYRRMPGGVNKNNVLDLRQNFMLILTRFNSQLQTITWISRLSPRAAFKIGCKTFFINLLII